MQFATNGSVRWRDDGMATAELAACLPVLVLLLAVALSAVSVGSVRVRAQDAAREAARAAARGDRATALAMARAAAPGAQVRISIAGGEVTAVATVRDHLPVPFLPSVTVSERAVATREPPP
jgi:Flp pilus assembly protein TadG